MRDKGKKRAYPWEKDKGERKGRRRGEQEEERRPRMDSGNAARSGRASGKVRRRKGEGVRRAVWRVYQSLPCAAALTTGHSMARCYKRRLRHNWG